VVRRSDAPLTIRLDKTINSYRRVVGDVPSNDQYSKWNSRPVELVHPRYLALNLSGRAIGNFGETNEVGE
jgi:hypothetical protein